MEKQNPPLLQQLRESLKPKGTNPAVIRLHMTGFFNEEFVQKAIDELENNAVLASAGLYEMSPLDQIAFEVLKESAEL